MDAGATILDMSSDDIKMLLQILRKKSPVSTENEQENIKDMFKSMWTLSAAKFDTSISNNGKLFTLKDIQEALKKDNGNSKARVKIR